MHLSMEGHKHCRSDTPLAHSSEVCVDRFDRSHSANLLCSCSRDGWSVNLDNGIVCHRNSVTIGWFSEKVLCHWVVVCHQNLSKELEAHYVVSVFIKVWMIIAWLVFEQPRGKSGYQLHLWLSVVIVEEWLNANERLGWWRRHRLLQTETGSADER